MNGLGAPGFGFDVPGIAVAECLCFQIYRDGISAFSPSEFRFCGAPVLRWQNACVSYFIETKILRFRLRGSRISAFSVSRCMVTFGSCRVGKFVKKQGWERGSS